MRTASERRAEAARARQITEESLSDRTDWRLEVFKRDARCKSGERKVNEYRYNDWTRAQMAEEARDLRNTVYRAEQGWRLEFSESWVTVKNLMSDKLVTIRAEDQGGVCDPSQERFWSI